VSGYQIISGNGVTGSDDDHPIWAAIGDTCTTLTEQAGMLALLSEARETGGSITFTSSFSLAGETTDITISIVAKPARKRTSND